VYDSCMLIVADIDTKLGIGFCHALLLLLKLYVDVILIPIN
jgi:hypothetical protein